MGTTRPPRLEHLQMSSLSQDSFCHLSWVPRGTLFFVGLGGSGPGMNSVVVAFICIQDCCGEEKKENVPKPCSTTAPWMLHIRFHLTQGHAAVDLESIDSDDLLMMVCCSSKRTHKKGKMPGTRLHYCDLVLH